MADSVRRIRSKADSSSRDIANSCATELIQEELISTALRSVETDKYDPTSDRSRPLVLVVEDDPSISAVLRLMLELSDYLVLTASDGKEAIEIASAGDIDAITLDLELPFLSGREVLKALGSNEATREIPVIIFSCVADEFAPMGQVRHVLTKPLGITEIVQSLDLCFEERALQAS